VLAAGKRANVPIGIFATTADEINRYLEQGFQAILAGTDVGFLGTGAVDMLERIKR
jgi:hypothetical protein